MQLTAYDKDDLRRTVPIVAVANSLGVRVNELGLALCPFHDDHKPSLSFYVDDDSVQRWGCFPCGEAGDAFDLVQRVNHVSFQQAIKYVSKLSGQVATVIPQPPKDFDIEGAGRLLVDAQRLALESDGFLSVAASLSEDPNPEYDELLRRFGWGVQDDATVVIPHYGADRGLSGLKFRAPDAKRWSLPGSRFVEMYGWQAVPLSDSLIVCEGESDYAHTRFTTPQTTTSVLSVPTGAGSMLQRWINDIRERWLTVYLAFDGDEAGLQATRRWTTALAEAGAEDVRIMQIPEGEDLRSCGTEVMDLMQGSYRAV